MHKTELKTNKELQHIARTAIIIIIMNLMFECIEYAHERHSDGITFAKVTFYRNNKKNVKEDEKKMQQDEKNRLTA